MRQVGSFLLIVVVGILTSVGFVVGVLLGPIIHGIMLGVEEVSSFIDRNTGG